MEKHTIVKGKVSRLYEKFAWYVLQGKSLYHLQINPTKQEYQEILYFFSRFLCIVMSLQLKIFAVQCR